MIKLYNSTTHKIEEFKSIKENEVSMYCCGPTVYNFAHIGNLRTFLFEDVLRRVLESQNYKVKHVMNITDVGHLSDDGDEGEDKLELSAKKSGKSVWDIAQFYTDAFLNDAKNLNLLPPSIVCKATDNVGQMIGLIKKLEKKGFTYTSNGNVYFDTSKFPEYGKMANLENITANALNRVEVDKNKKNQRDFVLWFTNSKFENHAMHWPSPWGEGYPGWHIECSAMSMRYLGDKMDIHCGGVDAINVHHTNEIAQSEACTGHPWVNYWLHGEFLLLKNVGKMSKSKGNFLTLQSLIDEGYDPLDYRYFCLSAHYRTQLQFSFEALDSARTARTAINQRLIDLYNKTTTSEILSELGKTYRNEFYENATNDLSMPKALAVVWNCLKDTNLSDGEKLKLAFDFDTVLGLKLEETCSKSLVIAPEVLVLIEKRKEARENKDWAASDLLRDEILKAGYRVKDIGNKTEVTKIM